MDGPSGKKIALGLAILALLALFFALDLDGYLTFSFLKQSRAELAGLYDNNPILFMAGYMLVYIVVSALAIPGAAVMTIAGGAILGFTAGTIAVSFASTIGATASCAASRYLFRDWVAGRFGHRVEAINEGVEKEGAFYLFTLRLIAVFPFFLVNLLMGLTKMPLRKFYWVSQIGMLPATMVYINAGREIGRIEGLSGILSPGLIVSFALIGLLPLGAKKTIAAFRSRKAKNIVSD